MSPPLPDSSPPVSVTVIMPSPTAQPVVGKPPPRALPPAILRLAVKEQPPAFGFFLFCKVVCLLCESKGGGEEHTQGAEG